jgi:hypothetical protein
MRINFLLRCGFGSELRPSKSQYATYLEEMGRGRYAYN